MTRDELIAKAKRKHLIEQARAKYQSQQSLPVPEAPVEEEEPGIGSKAFDYTMRGLDYLGGAGRFAASGYADLYNLAAGNPLINEPDTGMDVLKGKAPTTSEYLDRSGMEDGFAREAIGFAGDVALDPTTYMTGGVSAIGKAGKLKKLLNAGKGIGKTSHAKKILNPVGAASDYVGDKLIRSGVSQIDESLEMAGKGKLSDILIKENITGTNKSIKKKLDKLSGRFSKERADIYKKIDDADVKVNTDDLIDDFGKYTDGVRKKYSNEMSDKVATNMEEAFFDAIPTKTVKGKKVFADNMPVQKASDIKTQIRNSLPDSMYDGNQIKNQYKAGVKKLSGVFQKNIENAAEKAVPGMGEELSKKNASWSVLLDSDSPLGKEARKAAGKKLFTSVDAMILGGGQAADNATAGAKMLAIKKLGDLSKSTLARTTGGKAVKKTGTAIGEAMKRGAINYNNKKQRKK